MTDGGCGKCRYFQVHGNYPNIGDCRQKPPVVTAEGTEWPSVKTDEWCGEYQAAADDPETMSVPEAGRHFFGLSENGSYLAAARGDIPSVKIGRLRRVPVALLRRSLEARK